MTLDQVRKLQPFERFIYFIKEREAVRLHKEASELKPWTDDTILQSYRFCNIRRMDDKVSIWLMENWYKPNYDHPNILLAATLARQLNNPQSLEAIGFPRLWNPKRVETILAARAAQGLKNFSAAYMITGTLGGTKIQQIVHKVATLIFQDGPVIDRTSMEKTAESLLPYNGFSHFMAGQVVADLRWAMSGLWGDRKTWAPVGPGSKRGINRLLGRPKMASMNSREFQIHHRSIQDRVLSDLPSVIHCRLEAIDVQNCLCEYDKYCRALYGDGRPKQKYLGV